MSSLGELLPTLRRPKTKDSALDAILVRLEKGDSSAIAQMARTSVPSVLGRLEEATRGIGALQELLTTGPQALLMEVLRAQEPRRCAIEMLARALAPHLGAPHVEETLADLFASHPWHLARVAVGRGLLAGAPARATLERMASAMDDEALLIWVRHTGIAASVRADPATAYDRLAKRFEPEIATRSDLGRGLFVALWPCALGWPGPPIDPRWYPLLARAFVGDGTSVMELFKANPEPAAVRALTELLDRRTESRDSWLTHLGFTLMAWKKPETTAALLRAVASALDTTDERLTGPLGVLEAIGHVSVVPVLRKLLERAPSSARPALAAAIASLDRAPRPPPTPVETDAMSSERAVLVERLSAVGLGAERVRALVALARNRILIGAKYTKRALAVGKSRFGGVPDVPSGFAWPEVQGRSLAFVGQLDLAEVAPLDVDGLLPCAGVLSFFVRQDVTVDHDADLAVLASRVFFFERGAKLARVTFPAALEDHERDRPSVLTFARDLPVPPLAVAERLGLVLSETRAYETLDDDAPQRHASLGYARAAYYRGIPEAGSTLLLQVASDWTIFFVIGDEALAARRFEEARCVADEC